MELNRATIKKIVEIALKEDVGRGDITSNVIVPEGHKALGLIFSREDGILAGIEVARTVFEKIDENIKFDARLQDGDRVEDGVVIATVTGSARSCLLGERLCLNFLQRLSGIATLTRKFVDAVSGTKAKILDTRKTTPGLRYLEKYAVRVGGGINHRFGLYDMILIKDNHIQMAGSVTQAIKLAMSSTKRKKCLIEVEVKNISEFKEALAFNVDRIMLDNMNVQQIAEAVRLARGKVELEASGGITLENINEIAMTGVDYISVGELTHSARSLNFNMKLKSLGDLSSQGKD